MKMKVNASEYIKSHKDLLRQLLNQLLEIYPYASILAVDAQAFDYRVTKTTTMMSENDLLSNRGFVIKVYDGQSYGEYSFNELDAAKLDEIVAAVQTKVTKLKEGIGALSLSEYKILNDEPCVFSESTEYEIAPETLGDEAIINKLSELKDKAIAFDEKVLDAQLGMNYQKYSKLFLSRNRDMEQNVLWTNGALLISVKKGQQVKYGFKGFSNLGGVEMLDHMESAIPEVGKNALDLLEAEPMVPGEYECICTPEVTGMIAHEAFGHGVEMDMFVKDRALAHYCVGDYVAAPILTMHDGASINARHESATYYFDDEGTLATDTVVIKDGILQSGISDAQSAMYLGTVPTGNGRRESYKRKAYTRMTNTWFEPGKDKLEDMIASIKYGFLLQDASSGMEDPKNWGIQMMVNIAREIKDGKFTGKIFSPVVLTGYVPDLLKSITMMSDEASLCGTGFCGKGYKEWVKVSDGGPYIKAKIRLG
jgi:TldD protein